MCVYIYIFNHFQLQSSVDIIFSYGSGKGKYLLHLISTAKVHIRKFFLHLQSWTGMMVNRFFPIVTSIDNLATLNCVNQRLWCISIFVICLLLAIFNAIDSLFFKGSTW